MANVAIIINEQKITWASVQMVRRMCGGDWDQTIDAFWKARKATGRNGVMRYVLRGLVPNDKGVLYSLLPSPERERGQMESIRQWWMDAVGREAPKKGEPVRARVALKEMLMEMARGL
ncbi:MAG: hypothetical protein JXA71_19560 [Chitinispirillaceae bacterium]|nr:hypothetical protein [Chitinispirillaceae bacterium]